MEYQKVQVTGTKVGKIYHTEGTVNRENATMKRDGQIFLSQHPRKIIYR
jgi:hypothetical protein